MLELMTLPKIDFRGVPPEQIGKIVREALQRRVEQFKSEGKLVQVTPGSKVRILGYYNGDARNIRSLAPQEKMATWVKVEVLEGDASQKTGFTTADGVAE